jgi:hypothetical protein
MFSGVMMCGEQHAPGKQSRRKLRERIVMRKLIPLFLLLLLAASAWAQAPASAGDNPAQMRQEIDQLKKALSALEQRLAAQEKAAQTTTSAPTTTDQTVSVQDLKQNVTDLRDKVNETERKSLLDRLQWSGDYRFEGHSIRGTVPDFYDGMKLQNLMVRTFFLMAPQSQGGLGMPFDPNMLKMPPAQFAAMVNGAVQQNYAAYQYYTNNLKFSDLKGMLGSFPPAMQQQFMGFLMQVPGVHTNSYESNTNILYTNRLRLKFDAKVADNVSFTSRLSMYKVFGDSTGVQVFNGGANTMAMDGTTVGVPTGDMLRVERAYFSWNNIGGSKFYLSIGRRPSTEGPPLHFREDEPRGGTPSGSLIDYQFDGATFGYNVNEKMTLRACYGVGYSSGFGNGNLLHPANNVKDVHFLGGNFDLYNTEKTFVQATVARAFNVTDGFAGQVVMTSNPLTGEPVGGPVIMRYQPSANLGNINLYGVNVQKVVGPWDLFVSGNWVSTRPIAGLTTPFGGMMSDPFEAPQNREGHMIYAGIRYSIPKGDGRTKLGFEFNQGSKYWFNFAQAEDDIVAPKTNTRGEAYETYLTHRINDHFIFKADFIRYNYDYSGSGWHLGAPKALSGTPILGFPTYQTANMFTFGLTARF